MGFDYMLTLTPILEENAGTFGEPFFQKRHNALYQVQKGQWAGRGAELLGLANPVQRSEFRNLLGGRSPDTTRSLFREAPDPNRRVGWWGIFAPPPNLSMSWMLTPPGCRAPFERAHAQAVRSALGEFEAHVAPGRSQENRDQPPAALFATFRLDRGSNLVAYPQTMVFFVNVGVRPDGRAERFPAEEVLPLRFKMNECYESALRQAIGQEIGSELSWSALDPSSPRVQRLAGESFREYADMAKADQVSLSQRPHNPGQATVTITPIHAQDGNRAYQEFFQDGYASQRLGQPGRWTGTAAAKLPLANPVELAPFQNLLAGRSPDGTQRLTSAPSGAGDQNRILGWRLTFSSARSLNALWGLAPPASQAAIETAHAAGVNLALRQFQLAVGHQTEPGDRAHAPAPMRLLCAKFHSVMASDERSPDLRTTVFFFNVAWGEDGTIRTLSSDQVLRQHGPLKRMFDDVTDVRLYLNVGTLQREVGWDRHIIGIPREICRGHDSGPAPAQESARAKAQPMVGRSDRLLPWQEQTARLGWGPKQAAAFLRRAQWKQRVERFQMRWKDRLVRARLFLGALANSRTQTAEGQNKAPAPPPRKQTRHNDWGHSH